MVKSDLKNGMSFKTRYGDKCYIIDSKVYRNSDKDESILGLWDSLEKCLESYDDELLVLYTSPHGADIMEVYDIENNLVWKRKEIDWTKVPVDTKVYVREDENADWLASYFAGYSNGYYCTYPEGRTSWTNEKGNVLRWNQCKLVEEPKKEVPKVITAKNLSEKFKKYCSGKGNNYDVCSGCKYDYDRLIEHCKFLWLLDNYNVTEK